MSCLERLPYLHYCIALSGCSVLSTILSTQTSINSYYTVDTAYNLFAEFISKTDLSALLSCFNWLFCIIDYFVNTEHVKLLLSS